MGKRLYVGNLPYSTTKEDLRTLFGEYAIDSVVITDRETGRSKGFGFVTMETEEDAGEAIRQFNESDFNGRQLRVNEARERERRPREGGNGGDRWPPPQDPPREDRGRKRRRSRRDHHEDSWE
jgi:RNA recognition motif-containing protein